MSWNALSGGPCASHSTAWCTHEVHLVSSQLTKVVEGLKAGLNLDVSLNCQCLAQDRFYLSDEYKREVLEHMSIAQLIDTILINPTVHMAPSYRDTGLSATYTFQPLSNLVYTRDQQACPRLQALHVMLTIIASHFLLDSTCQCSIMLPCTLHAIQCRWNVLIQARQSGNLYGIGCADYNLQRHCHGALAQRTAATGSGPHAILLPQIGCATFLTS